MLPNLLLLEILDLPLIDDWYIDDDQGQRFSVANFVKFCSAIISKYPTLCSQLALLY